MIEPMFPCRQFLRFSFRRKRQPLLQFPPPYPNAAHPARSASSVVQLAALIEGVLGTSERKVGLSLCHDAAHYGVIAESVPKRTLSGIEEHSRGHSEGPEAMLERTRPEDPMNPPGNRHVLPMAASN